MIHTHDSKEAALDAHKALWDRFRKYFFHDEALGFSLDVSRMNFDEDFFRRLGPSLGKALEAMEALEAGAVANPDEKRRVGHYWLRAPERAPRPELQDEIRHTIQRIEDFAGGAHAGRIAGSGGAGFRHFLLIGIGGSALGPQLVADALGTARDKLRPHFLDNTDPDGIHRALESLAGRLDRTLAVVISKSGATQETHNGMVETMAAYRRAGLDFARHAVAVTGKGSKLETQARKEGWLEVFPMWDWVGGRTSVTSAVGLLPAALQGVDIAAFLAGARAMDELTRRRPPEVNPAALLAAMWHWAGGGQGRKDMVILPYKDRLLLLSKYLQQLVMESLGKELDRAGRTVHQGIAVYGNKGSTDQHAFVQQLRDGLNNFFVTFIEVQGDDAGSVAGGQVEIEPGVYPGDFLAGFLLGTRRALSDARRESITIAIRRLEARSLGMLIALFERAVGLYAALIDINAYHQPGVEAGKKAARAVVDLQGKLLVEMRKQGNARPAQAWAEAIDAPEQVETVFKILERLAANPGRGIQRTPGTSPFDTVYFAGE